MQIEFKATQREEQGSSASRRLRRAGQVPGIIYGGDVAATPITMDHNEMYHLLNKEAFHASVLTIDLEGKKQTVVLRDSQWHAYKPQVLHIDFQRVDADHKIHLKVPLHFVNGDNSPAVKLGGGMISHVINELDVQCLPANLPEFIEVDLGGLEADQSIHVSQIKLPKGVELVVHGEGDPVVVTVLKTKGEAAAEEESAEG
ncbi:50S ribosomal protein L25/general stress protein Ctc [Thauera sp. CAU 1555]|uniref:Large ribosomal subunit protein bL25 n=1 Tax=Thauera sedimentorum TaxID=2767595 RepID=A0ABR9BDM7_9RHOO|nr:50S ribosomal protein L25/general stress protein Ctc [Thauera sedimentorum]MBC9073526.1 50S ribosomal protein L25/general stress protein Ctc [Thauera sedimentorum]MBD8504445.1 50S ribosomal protein L25/general stress protein Ctc [Thauera sedimentorum]